MKKKAISTIVATVLIILITVAGVAIIWTAIIPLIKNGFDGINTDVDLRIVSSLGYTVWDSENRLATVQVKRGNDESDIIGFDLIFNLGGNSVKHYVDAVPEINNMKVYYVNLSGHSGDLSSISVAPVFRGGLIGEVVSELKGANVPKADIVALINSGILNAIDFIEPNSGFKEGDFDGGTCEVTNVEDSFACSDGDVYWYDNCGNKTDLKDDCSFGCSDGICLGGESVGFDGWRAVIMRTSEDVANDRFPGEGMQFPHSMVRSKSNPDYIYWAHDCGQGWRSRDAGDTWERFLGKGLGTPFGQSIEVDPENHNVIFMTLDNLWDSSRVVFSGLYRSVDAGDTWDFVLPMDYGEGGNRNYKHSIAYDLNSLMGFGAGTWYVAFANNSLQKSMDFGDTWQEVSSLQGHDKINGLYLNPVESNKLYLGSSEGFFYSEDFGENFLEATGLPVGEVTSLQINEQSPNEIYATIRGFSASDGLYKSVNGGHDFSVLKLITEPIFVSINQGYPEVMYLFSKEKTEVSEDGGSSWNDVVSHPREGHVGWGNEMGWSSPGAIIPNSESRCEAVGYANAYLWKSTDCLNFYHSNDLFSGYAWIVRDGMMFDYTESDRVGLFGADWGVSISGDGGWTYDLLASPKSILGLYGYVGNSLDVKAGAFQPGTDAFACSGGQIWGSGRMGLLYSEDNDGPWETTTIDGELWNVSEERFGSFASYFYNPDSPNELFVSDVKSVDGGKTFSTISYLKDNGLQIYGMCPSDSDVLYAMDSDGRNIYRSNDGGDMWNLYVGKSWLAYASGATNSYDLVFDLDVGNCDAFYTLYQGGDLGYYDGSSWTQLGLLDEIRSNPDNVNLVNLHSKVAYPAISSVIVDPNDNSVVYVTMAHSGISAIYRSVDSGQTWEDISYNLPRQGYASALSINPHSGEVFVSGCSGTWVLPAPYESDSSIYDNSISRPSCADGLKNGIETGVDEGGVCIESCSGVDISCGIYPSCNNCNEQDICVGDSLDDFFCSGSVCSSSVRNCNDCSCSCGDYAISEINFCSDGKDNDCNGIFDDEDFACGGIETDCSDDIDNDGDGFLNCFDDDCNGVGECIISLDGLVSWWKFEQEVGGQVFDEGGLYDGTLSGDSGISVDGAKGNVLNLSVGSYANFLDVPLEALSEISVSYWVRFNSADAGWIPVVDNPTGGERAFRLTREASERFACSFYNFSSSSFIEYSSIYVDTDWHHVVCVWDGSQIIVYVDGADDTFGENTLMTGTTPSDIGTIRIGGFEGSVDDVIIYNRALTLQEIIDINIVQSP